MEKRIKFINRQYTTFENPPIEHHGAYKLSFKNPHAQMIIETRIHNLKVLLSRGNINRVTYRDRMKELHTSLNQAKGGQ